MLASDLARLYDYGYWVNRKLLGVVSQLTPEQFTQPVAGSYGSIRNTLVHVMSADGAGSSAAAVRVAARLKDDDLAREITFAIGGGPKQTIPLGDLMQHGALHAVHHRGQVAMLLRMLGYVPGDFDLLFYAGDQGINPRL